MLFKEWIDFVIFPSDPIKVTNREQRLNTSDAVSFNSKDYTNFELVHEKGFAFTKDQLFLTTASDNEKFEAMWIDEDGQIFIWTTHRVWTLWTATTQTQKMIFLPRHPNSEELAKW